MAVISAQLVISGRELTETRISPDGRWVSFVAATRGGPASLVVVPAGGGPERIVTTEPGVRPGRHPGGGAYDWLPDGSGVVHVGADGNLWCQGLGPAPPRRLTDVDPAVGAQAPAVSPDGRVVAYVTGHEEVRLARIAAGDDGWGDGPLPAAGEFAADPCWWGGPGDAALVWTTWSVPDMPWDHADLVAVRPGHGPARLDAPGPQLQQPRAVAGGGPLGFLSDATGWLNAWRHGDDRPLLAEPHEHGGPAWGMGQRSWCWSPDGRRVAIHRNELGFGRLVVVDVSTGAVHELGRGVHAGLDWRGDSLVAIRSGARTPTEVVRYDVGSATRTTLAVGPGVGWDAAELVEPEPRSYPADDGVAIPARLYRGDRSVGRSDDRLICWLHGGPADQWPVGFLPRIAHWCSRGWDVLVPDHRGSTGHGRAFQQALDGRWGELDVADVQAVLRGAAAEGLAPPDRTVLMGSSSGGFTTLAVLARDPAAACAGVVAYPVTDLADLLERSHRFERHSVLRLVGPWPAAATTYRDRSPLHLADRLAGVPLLVLHGDADPVVPVGHSVALAERVRAAGGDLELVIYPGEGHGFRSPAHQLDEYERVARFLERHVG